MKIVFILSALLIIFLVIYFAFKPESNLSKNNVDELIQISGEEILSGEVGSIDRESGLIIDRGLAVVISNCSPCHSPKLVAQNHLSREGWTEVIRWMQEKQNLWDLGEQEKVILDYLEKNYAPNKVGRRKKLENIEWYMLNE